MPTLPVVNLFSDGACLGNPGPGGWACLLRAAHGEKELSGGESLTTNNRMELMAIIQGAEALKSPAALTITTDSQYVKNGMTQWIHRWRENGWRTASKSPVKNVDLWQRLEKALAIHQVTWLWVKGHSGHPENERVDRLASQAASAYVCT